MSRPLLRLFATLTVLSLIVVALAACGGAPATQTASQPAQAGQAAAPKKPDPNFEAVAKGQDKIFVSVEDVKKAYDAQADFVFVDARPATDYAQAHIVGAVNAPYFEVEKHLSKIPKDKWVITYCGCPHAEAEEAARRLMKAGYTKVKVIDEGFYAWVDKGWPLEKKS